MDEMMHSMASLRQVLMTWQGPAPRRRRYVVARIDLDDQQQASFAYETQNPDFKHARESGFAGYPAFPDFDKKYHQGVMASLATRLPPASRTDYPQFLRHWFMDPKAKPTLLQVLAYSGGALPRDSFGFVPVFPRQGQFDFVTELAGYQYRQKELSVQPRLDDPVVLRPQPDNPQDPDAIMVTQGADDQAPGAVIGYVQRGLHVQARRWLQHGTLSATIARLNGNEQRPLCYVHLWVILPA